MDNDKIIQNNNTEIWKAIPGYEGLYEASTFGRIKSLGRYVYRKDGRRFWLHEKIMSQFLSKEGYYAIVITGDNHHPVRYGVHRLIAKTFIRQDEDEKNHIDHIDGNPKNNCVWNLRWVTRTENMHNPITEARIDAAIGRRVIRFSQDGSKKEYAQIKDVEKDGFNRHKVCSCCTGHRLFHGGYVWVYKENEDNLRDFEFYLKERKNHYILGSYHRRKPIIAYNGKDEIEFSCQDEINEKGYSYNAIVNRIKSGGIYKGYYWRYK